MDAVCFELYFDTQAEEQVCDTWKAIYESGIGSSLIDAGYRPHVSLGVCNRLEPSAFETELYTFAAAVAPFGLSLSSIDKIAASLPARKEVVFLA